MRQDVLFLVFFTNFALQNSNNQNIWISQEKLLR